MSESGYTYLPLDNQKRLILRLAEEIGYNKTIEILNKFKEKQLTL